MSRAESRQRLAAILAADAAGYSRLMADDQRATVSALDAARQAFRAEILRHGGRVIDMAGDSVLAVFETAVGAVGAALEVQRTLDGQAARKPADRCLRFRIGVHLGDLVEKPDGSVYGDGVNIAARLEGLALPGGVAVSDAVRGLVHHRVAAAFEDLGEQSVKNIAEPVRVFRVVPKAPEELADEARRRAGPRDDATTSVMVVEDDPEFLSRFCKIVASAPELTLMGAVGDLASARRQLARQVPDVLLTDLGLPDGSGIDLIRETAQQHPATDIMVISIFGDEDHVLASIEAGATGYILKDSVPEEFVALITDLRAGGSPISPLIARRLLKRLKPATPASVHPAAAAEDALKTAPPASAPQPATESATAEGGLSPRESEVLGLVAKGFNFAEVARLLGVSPHTITAHVKKIYQKLAVHSRGEAVYEATRMGLL